MSSYNTKNIRFGSNRTSRKSCVQCNAKFSWRPLPQLQSLIDFMMALVLPKLYSVLWWSFSTGNRVALASNWSKAVIFPDIEYDVTALVTFTQDSRWVRTCFLGLYISKMPIFYDSGELFSTIFINIFISNDYNDHIAENRSSQFKCVSQYHQACCLRKKNTGQPIRTHPFLTILTYEHINAEYIPCSLHRY